MPRTVRTLAGPPVLYYLAIDGTEAQDAATFGALLEGRGWKNLATTYLKPAKDDPTRLVDPAHDYLPIPLVEAKGKKIAVVAPGGRDGKGLDKFWMTYPGSRRTKRGTFPGRYAAAEESAWYTSMLILSPAIESSELAPGKLSRHLADVRLMRTKPGPAARILYVSSHGWLSGRMQGEVMNECRPAQPPENQARYLPETRYFQLGAVAGGGAGFHGPEWIILAQCSTLNSATWPLWSRILARSSPGVRGILAYEEVSPAPAPSARIAESFFGHLDQGLPFLDAWVKANQGQRWAAMVHKEARKDTLKDLGRVPELKEVDTTHNKANYRGYLTSLGPHGTGVYDDEPRMGFKIEHQLGGVFNQVTPEVMGRKISSFRGADRYRLSVSAPDGSELRKASITLVHIRRSHPQQFNWNALFSVEGEDDDIKVSGVGSKTLTLTPRQPVASMAIQLRAVELVPPGLQEDHAYLWFRVEATTDAGVDQHDFTINGLEY